MKAKNPPGQDDLGVNGRGACGVRSGVGGERKKFVGGCEGRWTFAWASLSPRNCNGGDFQNADQRKLLDLPERSLWVASSELALLYDARRKDFVGENARRWIESDDTGIGSFRWICELLALDPDAVRSALTPPQTNR